MNPKTVRYKIQEFRMLILRPIKRRTKQCHSAVRLSVNKRCHFEIRRLEINYDRPSKEQNSLKQLNSLKVDEIWQILNITVPNSSVDEVSFSCKS